MQHGSVPNNDGDRLASQFLIAMPTLDDPNFSQTVTLVCEHSSEGAMGIIINRPTDVTLGDLFHHLELETDEGGPQSHAVFAGGPVQRERGFVLHPAGEEWEATVPITETVALTTSQDILAALARGLGPQRYLVALGYAGWDAGQLEQEIAQNAWLSGPAEAGIIFETETARRWRAAAAQLGVDISLLSSESGHA